MDVNLKRHSPRLSPVPNALMTASLHSSIQSANLKRYRSIWGDYTIAFDHSFARGRHLNSGSVLIIIWNSRFIVDGFKTSNFQLELHQIWAMSSRQYKLLVTLEGTGTPWAKKDRWIGVVWRQLVVLRDPYDIIIFQYQTQLMEKAVWY